MLSTVSLFLAGSAFVLLLLAFVKTPF